MTEIDFLFLLHIKSSRSTKVKRLCILGQSAINLYQIGRVKFTRDRKRLLFILKTVLTNNKFLCEKKSNTSSPSRKIKRLETLLTEDTTIVTILFILGYLEASGMKSEKIN